MYTREDYLNNVVGHSEYYRQFITDRTILDIGRFIKGVEIVQGYPVHASDHIPLRFWYKITGFSSRSYAMIPYNRTLASKAMAVVTYANILCIYKEAADIVLAARNKQP